MIVKNEERRGMIHDPLLAAFVFMETPFGTPKEPRSRHEAFLMPGCAVKSVDRENGGKGFPKHFGKLAEIDTAADVVTVLGKPMPGEQAWVWIGNQVQYANIWECD